jgi:hypothetical protein
MMSAHDRYDRYRLRDDAPAWVRNLWHDWPSRDWPAAGHTQQFLVFDDLADIVLDQMAWSLTSKYAERAMIAVIAGCCDRWVKVER